MMVTLFWTSMLETDALFLTSTRAPLSCVVYCIFSLLISFHLLFITYSAVVSCKFDSTVNVQQKSALVLIG